MFSAATDALLSLLEEERKEALRVLRCGKLRRKARDVLRAASPMARREEERFPASQKVQTQVSVHPEEPQESKRE